MSLPDCRTLDEETAALAEWQRERLDAHEERFEAAKEITTRLGAHWRDGYAEFGFWTPQLVDAVPTDDVRLELLTAEDDVDLTADEQTVTFDRQFVETRREGEFTWAAVEGPRPGTREQLGTLYRLSYEVDGERETVTDPFADSVPFGAYGPPELYDMDRLDEERDDREYFQNLEADGVEPYASEDDGLPRFEPATSMLEIHPGTATESGTLAGLKRQFETIGEKLADDDAELMPAERNFVGYDAVQLMPVAPITQNEDELGYWLVDGSRGDKLRVDVRRPDMLNWGYDIVISGFGTVNPAILESRRPDELVDLIATLHTLPEPVKVIFDIALGHADNGALPLLNEEWFAGPGMYGQELDYLEPVVRAGLLELQRRKMDFGADGIRVDGAQDFTNWDPEAEEEWHDDDYLEEMDRVTQEVAGVEYRPWMIYEDGRPWPRSDWELASTYRTLIEQHPLLPVGAGHLRAQHPSAPDVLGDEVVARQGGRRHGRELDLRGRQPRHHPPRHPARTGPALQPAPDQPLPGRDPQRTTAEGVQQPRLLDAVPRVYARLSDGLHAREHARPPGASSATRTPSGTSRYSRRRRTSPSGRSARRTSRATSTSGGSRSGASNPARS